MANIITWTNSFVGDFLPGAEHIWWYTGFNWGDFVDVSCTSLGPSPLEGYPSGSSAAIEVVEVWVESPDTGGLVGHARVRNSGNTKVDGYAIRFVSIRD